MRVCYCCTRDGEITAEEFAQLFAQSRRGDDGSGMNDNKDGVVDSVDFRQEGVYLTKTSGDDMNLDGSPTIKSVNIESDFPQQHLRSRQKRRRLSQRNKNDNVDRIAAEDLREVQTIDVEKKDEFKAAPSGLDPLFLAALAEADIRRSESKSHDNSGYIRRRSLRSRKDNSSSSSIVRSAADKSNSEPSLEELSADWSTSTSKAADDAQFSDSVEPPMSNDVSSNSLTEDFNANDWDLACEAIAVKVRDILFGVLFTAETTVLQWKAFEYRYQLMQSLISLYFLLIFFSIGGSTISRIQD